MGVGVTGRKTVGSSGSCLDKPEQMRALHPNSQFPEEWEGRRAR
jgi:hypothetical protein